MKLFSQKNTTQKIIILIAFLFFITINFYVLFSNSKELREILTPQLKKEFSLIQGSEETKFGINQEITSNANSILKKIGDFDLYSLNLKVTFLDSEIIPSIQSVYLIYSYKSNIIRFSEKLIETESDSILLVDLSQNLVFALKGNTSMDQLSIKEGEFMSKVGANFFVEKFKRSNLNKPNYRELINFASKNKLELGDFLDFEPPTIILSGKIPEETFDSIFNLKGKLIDGEKILLNEDEFELKRDLSFAIKLELVNGYNEFTLKAVDKFGNFVEEILFIKRVEQTPLSF